MRKAVYASGSGTANLDFAYEVQATDFDCDGVSLCSDTRAHPGCGRIQLDGGTIVAASDSAEAALALPDQDDQSGHKVGGTSMTFTPMPEIALTPPVPSIGEVPVDWSLYPSGLRRGKGFRLLFITTGRRDATGARVAIYNTFVQNAAGAGHADTRIVELHRVPCNSLRDGYDAIPANRFPRQIRGSRQIARDHGSGIAVRDRQIVGLWVSVAGSPPASSPTQ